MCTISARKSAKYWRQIDVKDVEHVLRDLSIEANKHIMYYEHYHHRAYTRAHTKIKVSIETVVGQWPLEIYDRDAREM